jgi:putative transposase
MPRKPRHRIPGLPQHVVQRGNDRRATFRESADYALYRRYLREALDEHCCELHAYCLMGNHVHLLLTPRRADSISKVVQSVGRRYVQYFNRAHERTGTLWEGRYKANLIQDDLYALMCYRYIELNPTRAGLVTDPGDYRYSSYRHNAFGRVDSLIREHPVYLALAESDVDRRDAYRRLVGYGLSDVELEEIRKATRTSEALGGRRSRFRQAAEAGKPR